jgi:hypothetical protein
MFAWFSGDGELAGYENSDNGWRNSEPTFESSLGWHGKVDERVRRLKAFL